MNITVFELEAEDREQWELNFTACFDRIRMSNSTVSK